MTPHYPLLFVGSAVEGLHIGEAVQQRLEHHAEVELWTEGAFVPTGSALHSLVTATRRADFALFIATACDVLTSRDRTILVMRDNVLFEAGLFIGALGTERVFLLVDRAENLAMPSDLAGITPITMDTRKQNPQSIVGAACTDIRAAMERLGRRENGRDE